MTDAVQDLVAALAAGEVEVVDLTQLANLARLPATGALLVAAPLKIVRGSGSPTRVFALVPRAA